MPDRGVTLQCPDCGLSWHVPPKPDGSMPAGARCPKARGGCGKLRKIPRAAITVPAAAPGSGWDPPSAPRPERDAAEPCPDCGGVVKTDRRGITRWCPACPVLVTPPGVLAPYERGAGVTRAARSQRDRDDDAKKTILIAGEFLRQVRAMLDDPKIHPASADLLTWYEEEISDARKDRDGRRLAELAREFADDRETGAFRRQHWWQGEPAALAGLDDEDDEEDDGQGGEPAAVVLAAPVSNVQQPAQPRWMTWAEARAACGWRMSPVVGGCQIIDERGQRCGAETRHYIGDGWVCDPHHATLGGVITDAYYGRSA